MTLYLAELTFFAGGLIRGIRAVRSIITFQEAVNAAAITAAELRGITGGRAYCWGDQHTGGGEERCLRRCQDKPRDFLFYPYPPD